MSLRHRTSQLFVGRHKVFARTPLARLTDLYTQRVTRIIKENAVVALPAGRVYDGESLLPLLEGKGLKRSPDEPFYYNCENLQAVRLGDWKVHLLRQEKQLPFWDKAKQFRRLEQPVLYNLRDDPGESRDRAQARARPAGAPAGRCDAKRARRIHAAWQGPAPHGLCPPRGPGGQPRKRLGTGAACRGKDA
jgi:hypothetical protein